MKRTLLVVDHILPQLLGRGAQRHAVLHLEGQVLHLPAVVAIVRRRQRALWLVLGLVLGLPLHVLRELLLLEGTRRFLAVLVATRVLVLRLGGVAQPELLHAPGQVRIIIAIRPLPRGSRLGSTGARVLLLLGMRVRKVLVVGALHQPAAAARRSPRALHPDPNRPRVQKRGLGLPEAVVAVVVGLHLWVLIAGGGLVWLFVPFSFPTRRGGFSKRAVFTTNDAPTSTRRQRILPGLLEQVMVGKCCFATVWVDLRSIGRSGWRTAFD